jgi:hypothetical protein
MKHALCLLSVALVIPACVYGRLGETEKELAGRLGAPASKSAEITLAQGKIIEFGSKLTFRQGDWTIECAVIEGRCARVVYAKMGDWTEDQFITVLTSNSQGAKWTDVSKEMTKKLAREWRREDGAVAIWHMGVGMTVTSPAYDRAKQKAEAKAKSDASQIPKI